MVTFFLIVIMFMTLRMEVVTGIRNTCIIRDYAAYCSGPDFGHMVWALHKWTFKQFYRSNGK